MSWFRGRILVPKITSIGEAAALLASDLGDVDPYVARVHVRNLLSILFVAGRVRDPVLVFAELREPRLYAPLEFWVAWRRFGREVRYLARRGLLEVVPCEALEPYHVDLLRAAKLCVKTQRPVAVQYRGIQIVVEPLPVEHYPINALEVASKFVAPRRARDVCGENMHCRRIVGALRSAGILRRYGRFYVLSSREILEKVYAELTRRRTVLAKIEELRVRAKFAFERYDVLELAEIARELRRIGKGFFVSLRFVPYPVRINATRIASILRGIDAVCRRRERASTVDEFRNVYVSSIPRDKLAEVCMNVGTALEIVRSM